MYNVYVVLTGRYKPERVPDIRHAKRKLLASTRDDAYHAVDYYRGWLAEQGYEPRIEIDYGNGSLLYEYLRDAGPVQRRDHAGVMHTVPGYDRAYVRVTKASTRA